MKKSETERAEGVGGGLPRAQAVAGGQLELLDKWKVAGAQG